MGTYRKKPVVIEAWPVSQVIAWFGENFWGDMPQKLRDAYDSGAIRVITSKDITVHTLEGNMIAQTTDMLICEVEDEFYPCKPEIFEKTYEAV